MKSTSARVVVVLLVLWALALSTGFQYYFLDREIAKHVLDWTVPYYRDRSAPTTAPAWLPNAQVGARYYTSGATSIDATIIDHRTDMFTVRDDEQQPSVAEGPKAWLVRCIRAPNDWWSGLSAGYLFHLEKSNMLRPWMWFSFVFAGIAAFVIGLFARARIIRHHRLVQQDLMSLPWSVVLLTSTCCALAGGVLCWYIDFDRSIGLPHDHRLGLPPMLSGGLIALVAGSFGFVFGRRVILEPERRRRGQCVACGYASSPTDKCPECGAGRAAQSGQAPKPWISGRLCLGIALVIVIPFALAFAAAVVERNLLERNTIGRWLLLRPIPSSQPGSLWMVDPKLHKEDAKHWFNYPVPAFAPQVKTAPADAPRPQ